MSDDVATKRCEKSPDPRAIRSPWPFAQAVCMLRAAAGGRESPRGGAMFILIGIVAAMLAFVGWEGWRTLLRRKAECAAT